MGDDTTALLAILADPKAAKQRLDELTDQTAKLDAANAQFEKLSKKQDAREKELKVREASMETREGELKLRLDKLAKDEDSLAQRANLITASETRLQSDVVAHGQEHGKRSAELNTREQNAVKLDRELKDLKAKLEADQAVLDKKLAKAREFIAA